MSKLWVLPIVSIAKHIVHYIPLALYRQTNAYRAIADVPWMQNLFSCSYCWCIYQPPDPTSDTCQWDGIVRYNSHKQTTHTHSHTHDCWNERNGWPQQHCHIDLAFGSLIAFDQFDWISLFESIAVPRCEDEREVGEVGCPAHSLTYDFTPSDHAHELF